MRPADAQQRALENTLAYMEALEQALRTGTLKLNDEQLQRADLVARRLHKNLRAMAFHRSGILRTDTESLPRTHEGLVIKLARELSTKQAVALRTIGRGAASINHENTSKALVRKGLVEKSTATMLYRLTTLGAEVLQVVKDGAYR
jgi:hypothetical protein